VRPASKVFLSFAVLFVACGPGDREESGGVDSAPNQTSLSRADSLYAAGEFSGARDLWLEELRKARQNSDPESAASLLTSLGLAARHLGDYASSRAWGEEALDLKLHLGLESQLFRSYNALGLLAWTEGRLDDAVRLFSEASRAAAARGDDLGVAKAVANMAQVHTDRGEWSLARRGFQRLEDASRTAADTVLLGRALINLAMLDIRNGDPLPAIAGLEEARALARAAGDSEAEENAQGQLATAYQLLGEPQRAFAALDSALDLAQRHGLRRQAAEDVKLLGELYAAAGDHRGALDHYQQARVLAEGLDLVDETGNLLLAEAQSLRVLGLVDSAAVRAGRASRLHGGAGYIGGEIQDLLLLAQISADQRRDGEAEGFLAEASSLAEELGTPLAKAQVALASARIADRRGDPESVLGILGVAADVLGRLGETDLWEPDALRARAYARLGQLDAAEAAGRRSVAWVERVRGAHGSPSLRTSLLSARAEVYGDLVLILLRQHRLAEAFEVADAARGRALLDHLGAARSEVAEEAGAAETLLRASDLLRDIDELVQRLRALEGGSSRDRSIEGLPPGDSLQARLSVARSEYERLLSRLAQVPERALLGDHDTRAGEVQSSLNPGEVLLEYMVLDQRLEVFALSLSGLTHLSLPVARDALAAQTRLALDLTSGDSTDPSPEPVLGALHDALLGPVIRAGALEGAKRLVLVPHGPLVYLPFAALLDNHAVPLAQRYSLLFLPSASALPALRALDLRRLGSPGEGALVLAPLPEELPWSRREAEDVAAALGTEGIRTILGTTATEQALRRGLEASRVVHVATHGIMNPLNPMFTGVDLRGGGGEGTRNDGRLEVREILGLRVASDLVYLSGCETGRAGAWSTGFETHEDYATLAQAFLYAGARNVVATLWRVPDDGAAAFAARFYRALAGRDPVEALAAAQREMLSDPRYAAPYYWAAYQITGSGSF